MQFVWLKSQYFFFSRQLLTTWLGYQWYFNHMTREFCRLGGKKSRTLIVRSCNFNRQCQICGLFQSIKRTSPIYRDVNQILHRICVNYATNLPNFTLIQDICIKLKSKRAPALACNTGMRPQWQAPIVKKQLQKAKKSIGSNAQAQ